MPAQMRDARADEERVLRSRWFVQRRVGESSVNKIFFLADSSEKGKKVTTRRDQVKNKKKQARSCQQTTTCVLQPTAEKKNPNVVAHFVGSCPPGGVLAGKFSSQA
jgi:hypothetical protein